MRDNTLLKLALAVVFALGVGGAAALAGVFNDSSSDTAPPIYQPQKTLPTTSSADAALSAALAPLRRDQGTNDVPPARVGLDPYATQHGANRSLARLARTDPAGGNVYLVPANTGVCFMSSDYLLNGCRSTDDVLSGQDMTAISCSPFMPPDDVVVYGLLPDAASDVSIVLADGTSVPASVQGNVLIYEAPKSTPLPQTVHWTDANGEQSAPTNMPVEAASDKCNRSITPAQAVAQANASQHATPPPNAGPTTP